MTYDNPCITQVVEEEFKQTAASLGVAGAEANALAHHWASPEATGLHPPGAQPMQPTPFNDSAHSRPHTGQESPPATPQCCHHTTSAGFCLSVCAVCTLQVPNNFADRDCTCPSCVHVSLDCCLPYSMMAIPRGRVLNRYCFCGQVMKGRAERPWG